MGVRGGSGEDETVASYDDGTDGGSYVTASVATTSRKYSSCYSK